MSTLKLGTVYTIRLKKFEDLKKDPKVSFTPNSITIGDDTGYTVIKKLGGVVSARFNGNNWLGEDYFIIPKYCVESVYVPSKKV